jgi:predicted anti-sigma-YlaC factor YlaD
VRAREAVSARLDGELNELEGARLDQHLRECEACRAFASGAGVVARQLRTADLEPAPAGLFVPQRPAAVRRRIAAPFAAAAAALIVAAATGSSFLVGQLLGARAGHGPAAATTASVRTTGVDPGMVAMLGEGRGGGRPQTGRVIAL